MQNAECRVESSSNPLKNSPPEEECPAGAGWQKSNLEEPPHSLDCLVPRNDGHPLNSKPQTPNSTRGAELIGTLTVAARHDNEYILYGVLAGCTAYLTGSKLVIESDNDGDVKRLNASRDYFLKALERQGVTEFEAQKLVPPDDPDKEIIERLRSLAGDKLVIVE